MTTHDVAAPTISQLPDRPAVARVPLPKGSLPSLTGMRWAAALLVFLHHIRNFGYFGGESGRLGRF
ncbi:hypothetical protein [Streptomyces acidiscabies]|uniref:hypothetical protein n=1 Tax=Streptomyces acidiscabies TaxID=42234 RepID=UPI0027401D1C|nr:hypothetical protein [Streptomyces acidiscabies]